MQCYASAYCTYALALYTAILTLFIWESDARASRLVARCISVTLCRQGQDVAPARVIVFCADEDAAKKAAMPLRSGLWGEHTVSVLLPHGEEPIQVTS